MADLLRAGRPARPLPERRAHALARIERDRAEVAANWRTVFGVVRERERGALALTQGVAIALKFGSAVAAIWLAGRIRGPRFVRRGVMFMTAIRAAGRLLARRHHARG